MVHSPSNPYHDHSEKCRSRKTHIKTKIICTIGPKTQSSEMIGKLIEAGMNVLRMNFSHGTHEYHATTIRNLRTYISTCKPSKIVAILLDTKGPEIRTGKLKGGQEVQLVTGDVFTFYIDYTRVGDEKGVGISYSNMPKVVYPGTRILVGDGLISFEVTETGIDYVKTVVLNDGILGETKGVNLPGIQVDLPAVTEKDIADIKFGIEHKVDFIAASFIRRAEDVHTIRNLLGDSKIKIISKIENQQGLDNFDEILQVSDGIMVARGDLGVEIPVEQVARAQKMMIKKCNYAGKPCITATQMLESMIQNPRPTRAEATDVANAVLDGSDCVMLSGETAKGSYPIEAVSMMASICKEAEADIDYAELYNALRRHIRLPISVGESIASVAVRTSWDVRSPLVIVLSQTGHTIGLICKYRPIPPVIGVTSCPMVARQMQLLRGIYPFIVDSMKGTDNIIIKSMLHGVQLGMAIQGDPIVITSGILEQTPGSTNMMKVKQCVGFES